MSTEKPKLQVWWIPQIPGKSFTVEVATPDEGAKLLRVLADYDLFQYENNIKPDYSNAGGLQQESADPEDSGWEEWCDDDGNDVNEAFPDVFARNP